MGDPATRFFTQILHQLQSVIAFLFNLLAFLGPWSAEVELAYEGCRERTEALLRSADAELRRAYFALARGC